MFTSTGIIRYEGTKSYRLVVKVDPELAAYYRSMIPKYYRINVPMWDPHITVVRPEKEIPVHLEHWGKHEGSKVEFLYEPTVYSGKIYFWLNIWCKRLEELRLELGLPVVSQFTLPPEGFVKCFHCTIANMKNCQPLTDSGDPVR